MVGTTSSSSAGEKATPRKYPRMLYCSCTEDKLSLYRSIHDHANSHCFMRVMEGSLQEIQYAWPASSQSRGQPVTELNKRDLVTDEVTYINGMLTVCVCMVYGDGHSLPLLYIDSIGLHRIQNISHTDPAISLHLYSPPITTCHTFEQRTGRAHSCTVSFFSRNGSVCSNYSTCSASAS